MVSVSVGTLNAKGIDKLLAYLNKHPNKSIRVYAGYQNWEYGDSVLVIGKDRRSVESLMYNAQLAKEGAVHTETAFFNADNVRFDSNYFRRVF